MFEPVGIVINPYAGNDQWKKAEKAVDQAFNVNCRKVKLFKKKEVFESVSSLLGWAKLIIIIGGDGSFKNAARAIVRNNHSASLLFIPTGTANDMAYNLRIPKNPKKVLNLISGGVEKEIDIGEINTENKKHIFVNVFGLAGSVDLIQRFKELKEQFPRFFSYAGAFGKSLFSGFLNSETKIEIIFRKGITWKFERTSLCMVMNGQRCGRFFKMAPKAKLDDGLLDLCFASKLYRLNMLNVFDYCSGRFISGSNVKKIDGSLPQADQFDLKLGKARKFQADGDIIGKARKFHINTLKKKIRVLVPKREE